MRLRLRKSVLFTVALLISLVTLPVAAQDGPSEATAVVGKGVGVEAISGSLSELARPFGECRLGAFNSNRNLDEVKEAYQTACLLNWKPKLAQGVQAGFSARAIAASGPTLTGRQPPSGSRIREAFLQLDRGDWMLRLGRQHIVWGRADRISPTDVLSPRDLTFLAADDDEQRNGIDAALARVQLSGQWTATAAVSRFEPNGMPQGALPANLLNSAVAVRTEWSFRLDRNGSGWDGALSYFDGLDRTPRYWANATGTGVSFDRSHERQKMVGVDFATANGRWTFRAEAAFFRTSALCGACPLVERNIRRWVLGADRDFGESSNVNLQVFGVVRDGYTAPDSKVLSMLAVNQGLDRLNSEYAGRETGLTFRWSTRLRNERLKLELGAIKEFTHGSWVARPRLSYAWSDALTLRAGADHFSGDAQSYFGSRKKKQPGLCGSCLDVLKAARHGRTGALGGWSGSGQACPSKKDLG